LFGQNVVDFDDVFLVDQERERGFVLCY